MTALDHLPYHLRDFDVDGYRAYLESQGAVILKPTNEWEVVRYRSKDGISIIYRKATGRLTYTGWSNKHYRDFQRGWKLGEPAPSKPAKPRALTSGQRQTRYMKILKRDGKSCWFCALPLGEDITLEHLIPRSVQGGNGDHNLVLAHKSCNQMADNKPLAEKIALREELTKQAEDGRYEP